MTRTRGPMPSGRTKLIGTMVTPDDHARVAAEAARRGIAVSTLLGEILAPEIAKMPPASRPARPPAPRRRAAPEATETAARIVLGPPERRDITGIIMGDPPPERSALGRRVSG